MGKGIYTYYKERLIEIGGNNKCLYLKSVSRKSAYDIGRIFMGREDKVSELVDFLWSSGKKTLSLISGEEKGEILKNVEMARKGGRAAKAQSDLKEDLDSLDSAALKKLQKAKQEDETRAVEAEVTRLKELKREVEEIERETGRCELYIGYPFVFGCIPQGTRKTLIKAPLLLFPVRIDVVDEGRVDVSFNESEKIHINHALVYAYAQSKRLSVEQLDLEYDEIGSHFASLKDVIAYLAEAGIKIEYQSSKNTLIYSRFKEPEGKMQLSVRHGAVLGRFPLSNSIYSDYSLLEKKNLTNDALTELLRTAKGKRLAKKKKVKRVKKQIESTYPVKMMDYAQSEVLRKVNENGNMVIYGPPGTGKSQTIVNIITDAIVKHKSVLVVSQKKAALDVVYNRLGRLNEKAMYITDETKQKQFFYDRCLSMHHANKDGATVSVERLEAEYAELEDRISDEVRALEQIYDTLNKKRQPFGLSLSEMYSLSSNISKGSSDYQTYTALIEQTEIMALSYKELSEALFGIREMNLAKMYYTFMQDKEKNPVIDYMKSDIDIRTLTEVKDKLSEIQKSKKGLFNTAKHPYYRQILAYYPYMKSEEGLDAVVRLERKLQKPNVFLIGKTEKQIKEGFLDTLDAIEAHVKEYGCLHNVLTPDGYLAVIDNILRGNTSYIKLVYEALDNYIALRDVNKLLESLDKNKLAILNFSYTLSKSYSSYLDIIERLPEVRIYHEVLKYEEECKDELAKTMDFSGITSKIYKLKEAQLEVAYKLSAGKNSKDYDELYDNDKENKDFLYQISKKQKYWPIRKTMEYYSRFILSLFPCWLLSPENVSCLLPLEKNMFDIVIFDEASQVFIESTIPSIYRGKSIVVAGDDKQLRPSATFMRRYLGADPEAEEDLSVQAALEVDSLLDLAVARYESASLSYHYRSRNQELIDFSNAAFYNSSLQIAPNIHGNGKSRPIERYKVNGRWIDRKNEAEAAKVVDILKDIFRTRKMGESIGIITFNADQQSCIADMIDKEISRDADFRSQMLLERHRMENGEDTGIFIKNLENVQGDKRDIIIFSIGYAENESGKVYTSFGSLSVEGGENRLNVAITRAKSRIIVVTSIEPEDLKVDGSKHQGPKLLQKYLKYVRAVSDGNEEAKRVILNELNPSEYTVEQNVHNREPIENQIKARLEKQGYKVDMALGSRSNRISLAVFDPDCDRYLVGVELDKDAFATSSQALERDVYKPKFLEARGWTVMRVWCRDWWLYPAKVIKAITSAAEKSKKALK